MATSRSYIGTDALPSGRPRAFGSLQPEHVPVRVLEPGVRRAVGVDEQPVLGLRLAEVVLLEPGAAAAQIGHLGPDVRYGVAGDRVLSRARELGQVHVEG